MLPQSKFMWDTFTILRNFQFTYRLLLFVALFTSFLAGVLSNKLDKKIIILLCFFAIFQTILNWGNRRTIPTITDEVLTKQLTVANVGEGFQPAAPKWVNPKNPWQEKNPIESIEILKGEAEINEKQRTSTQHQYRINVKKDTILKENTLYFPGWNLYVNNKIHPVHYTDKNYPGIILFSLPKGEYTVNLIFTSTKTRTIAQSISIITGINMIFVLGVKVFRRLIKEP